MILTKSSSLCSPRAFRNSEDQAIARAYQAEQRKRAEQQTSTRRGVNQGPGQGRITNTNPNNHSGPPAYIPGEDPQEGQEGDPGGPGRDDQEGGGDTAAYYLPS